MTQNQIKSQFPPPHVKIKKKNFFPLTHKQKASCLCCHNFILNTRCPGVGSPVSSLTKVQFLLCSRSSGPPHTGARGCVPFPVQSLAVSCRATFAESRPHWRCVAGTQTSVSPGRRCITRLNQTTFFNRRTPGALMSEDVEERRKKKNPL